MKSPRQEIFDWAERGRLKAGAVADALALAGVTPDAIRWRRFVDALFLWLGSLLIAAGVIFFFAYNWDALGRFTKFGLVEGVFALAVLAASYAGLEKHAGKAALLLASLLTGALLALIGQTYQTGADPYELFAIWALLILPWVIVARLPVLWLLFVALLNLTVGLYFQAARGLFGILFSDGSWIWSLFALNTASLVAWEAAMVLTRADWMQSRWPARVLVTASGTLATILGVWAIFESREVGPFAFPAYALWIGAAYFYYRYRTRDLFVLAGAVLSLIVHVSAFLGDQLLDHAEPEGFLVIGLVVIGMSAGGAWWLRRIAAEEEA